VLVAALALAVFGWVAAAGTDVETDVRDLAPADLRQLEALRTLEEETGISGEVDVVVRSDQLTDPEVIGWMRDYQQRVLERHGFGGEFPSCEEAELCPAISLIDLFAGAVGEQTSERARSLIESIPPYFSQAVITRDPETGEIGDTANIAFGIRAQPLDSQQELIEDIQAQIDPVGGEGPPPGTEVEIAGLPVLAAEANADLSRSRWWLPAAALVAVALVLGLAWRSARRALVPLLPVLLATGWSALVAAAMEVPLNPMSATLGALVIAIATEFSVLLSARFEAERAAGLSVGESLRRTYSRTGAAVLASGVTVIAGFAVLVAAGIPFLDDLGLITVAPILRDFGLVTVVDLAVVLAGVMVVLPAALVWADEGFPLPGWARLRRPAPGRAEAPGS
jgi:predicted RND superfamily exporter protein